MSTLVAAAEQQKREFQEAYRRVLLGCGDVCAGSGVLRRDRFALELHSDFGPPEQDKDQNQDYALAWVGNEGNAEHGGPEWALALADGVSSSYYAEVAAKLACWASLAQLVSEESTGEDCAWRGIDAAGGAIGRLADLVEGGGEAFRPHGEFASSWNYTLRNGLLLQTTLTLCWLARGHIHVAIVGDGGAVFEQGARSDRWVETLDCANGATNRVHALGPRNRAIEELDCWYDPTLEGPFRLALFTDGVGRGLQSIEGRMFDELDVMSLSAETENRAAGLIERWLTSHATAFADNLTLALVTQDGPCRQGG